MHLCIMALPQESFRRHLFSHPHEKKQFDFFNSLNHPHFGLVATVNVAPLQVLAKAEGISFTLAVVHTLSTAANSVPHLRRRIRGNEIVEHEAVHPSFAVPTQQSDGFSFCEVAYYTERLVFANQASQVMEKMLTDPVFSDDELRDDYLFMSAIPWVHFTGIQHAMGYHPVDSVPRISWGKVLPKGDEKLMPVSIQAHHAVVDGRALGMFYERLEALIHH